jgi:hypothetical protein
VYVHCCSGEVADRGAGAAERRDGAHDDVHCGVTEEIVTFDAGPDAA